MSKKVYQSDLEGNIINNFTSVKEASDLFNYKQSNISACCNGKIRTAYGFIWGYHNDTSQKLKKCPSCKEEKSFLHDFDPYKQFCKECLLKLSNEKRDVIKIIVTDPCNKRFNIFDSIGEASKITLASRTVIKNSIEVNSKKRSSSLKCGYYFYSSDISLMEEYNSAEDQNYISEYTIRTRQRKQIIVK